MAGVLTLQRVEGSVTTSSTGACDHCTRTARDIHVIARNATQISRAPTLAGIALTTNG
jgi:hypothetical protein